MSKSFIINIIVLSVRLIDVLAVGDNDRPVIECANVDIAYRGIFGIYSGPVPSMHNIKRHCSDYLEEKKRITVKGSVKTIYEDSFKDIPNLYEINIVNVSLQNIQSGSFNSLTTLKYLYLEGNNLNEIKNATFINLKTSILYLGRNSISVLRPGSFQNLSKIKELSLKNNKLKEIKRGVFQNVSLLALNLENNKISKIEAGAFANLFAWDKFGITLSLSNNNLETIDPLAFDNKDISVLELANNSIASPLPGDFSNLPNLYSLILTGNNMWMIMKGVFNGSNIRMLKLDHCNIFHIASGAFDNMEHLLYLDTRNNTREQWYSLEARGIPHYLCNSCLFY